LQKLKHGNKVRSPIKTKGADYKKSSNSLCQSCTDLQPKKLTPSTQNAKRKTELQLFFCQQQRKLSNEKL